MTNPDSIMEEKINGAIISDLSFYVGLGIKYSRLNSSQFWARHIAWAHFKLGYLKDSDAAAHSVDADIS